MATIVGGNFGGKNEITTEPVLALLSKKTGRPVKCTFTRSEEFIASTTRHPLIMDYKTGVTKAGQDPGAQDSPGAGRRRVLLLERNDARQGLHPFRRALQHRKPARGSVRRVHEQDHDRARCAGSARRKFVLLTNRTWTTSPHALDIDPLDIRLLNAFEEGSISPTGQKLQSVVVKRVAVARGEAVRLEHAWQ